MDIRALAYVGFESPAYRDWETFGPEIFGFGLAPDEADECVRLRMDSRHHRIAIHTGEEDRLAYIGWEVPDARALDAACRDLAAAGYEAEVGDDRLKADRRVLGVVAVTDPAGYRHELAYGQQYTANSFVPVRPTSGFVAEELGVGHIVVVAELTAEYRSFLLDLLGLRTYADFPVKFGSEGPSASALFVRCNERSHCMAVLPLPGLHGVHHLDVETNSLHDVGAAYDMIQDRNIPVTMTLGSHTIDPTTSFYCRTPSGFDLEFSHGGALLPAGVTVGNPSRVEIWGHRLTGAGMAPTIKPTARP